MNLLSNLNVTLFKYETVINLIAHLLFHKYRSQRNKFNNKVNNSTAAQTHPTTPKQKLNCNSSERRATVPIFCLARRAQNVPAYFLTHLKDFVHDEYIANESFDSKYFCSQSTRGPLDRMLSSCRLPHFEELFLLILINKLSRY